MELPEFVPWASIPRLYRDIVITEKIDGTNGIIHVTTDGQILAGSRSKWLINGDDNAGFAKWVNANAEELINGLGPGTHYGEWWGAGIQRRYGLTEKRFSLFNAERWTDDVRPKICHVVPTLYSGPFSQHQIDSTLAELALSGSVAAPGFMDPEGVVIFHKHSRHTYKVTIKNDQVPKSLVKEN
jgi:hypothetical protein